MNKKKHKSKIKAKKLEVLNSKALQKLVMPNKMCKPIHAQPEMLLDPFDVLVIATMSSGKSTLINALLGRELLHAANEATTSCLTSVEQRDLGQFYNGVCYSLAGDKISMHDQVTSTQLRLWNADQNVKRISISGSFFGLSGVTRRLVLHDTPGPNNSRDSQHKKVMQEALDHIRTKIIIYVLNTEQLGTNDDQSLLMLLRKKLVEHATLRIVFVLNKIDLLDVERGENIRDFIHKAQNYIERSGFDEPIIIPIASNAALYARKVLNKEVMTSVQRRKLKLFIDGMQDEKYILIQSAIVGGIIKTNVLDEMYSLENAALDKKYSSAHSRRILELYQLIASSGIRTLEFFIQDLYLKRCTE